jgi:hypothetical protein
MIRKSTAIKAGAIEYCLRLDPGIKKPRPKAGASRAGNAPRHYERPGNIITFVVHSSIIAIVVLYLGGLRRFL